MNNIAHFQFDVRIVVQNDRPRNCHVMNTRETLFLSAMWIQVICLPDLFPQSTQECQAMSVQVHHRSEPRNTKKPLQTPVKCHVVWQNWLRPLIQNLNENMGCWPVCIKGDWPTRTFVCPLWTLWDLRPQSRFCTLGWAACQEFILNMLRRECGYAPNEHLHKPYVIATHAQKQNLECERERNVTIFITWRARSSLGNNVWYHFVLWHHFSLIVFVLQ